MRIDYALEDSDALIVSLDGHRFFDRLPKNPQWQRRQTEE